VDLKKTFLKFIVFFSYLNLLIIFDGNISLRYLYDDISRLIILGQDFFITPLYIVLLIAIIGSLIDYYLSSKITFEKRIIVSYAYNFTIFSFSTLLILYFLRIYDISRFLLILFLITCPIIFIIVNYIKLEKIKLVFVLPLIIFGVIFNFFINSNSSVNKALKIDSNIVENIIEEEGEKTVNPITRYLDFVPSNDINEGIAKEVTLSTNYKLTKHQICCFEYSFYENGGKSVGYIELYKDKLLYATGSAILLYTEKPTNSTDQIKFNEIKNNLNEVILNSYVFDPVGWESLKDMLIIDEQIYISYIEEVGNDCVSNAIVRADLNFEYLNFEKFYTIEECVIRSVSPFNAHQSGGKLAKLPGDELILTTGDFRAYEKPQDMNSKFGKILKINLNTGSDEIISIGHRNPQGLFLSDDMEYLLISEHGPKGGDEINIINLKKVQNYGWPMSSYGTHYDGGTRTEAPLYKSHESYGFVEPAWYFEYEQNDLHGISAIEKDYSLGGNNYLIATLKGNIIYEVEINFNNSEVTNISPMKVGARVRDIEYDIYNDFYYLIMENTPSIGILTKNNK
tara:strand:- start:163 stop:1866 length:1704 start_codon:yes stop_codon:yes gene_type:complete